MKTRLSLLAELYHAVDSLGLYRAELARILGLTCAEASDATGLRALLQQGGDVRRRAERFVQCYRLLELKYASDSVARVHWFRKPNALLGTTPLLAIVDHDRLDEVIDLLE